MTPPGRRWLDLPLAVWAAALSGAGVLLAVSVVAVVLAATGGLNTVASAALAAGAGAGLLLAVVAGVSAARLGRALRALHAGAAQRLHDPSAPVARPGRRPAAGHLTTEVAELARVLDALHLRVRVADEVGARYQRDARTAGAGVFELLSGLVAAEEGARGQLAAELHDTVAQSLMLARSLLAAGPLTGADLVRLADHVEDAEEQVRAVMARTRPPALRDGDLASAVAGLRDDMATRYGLRVDVRWPGNPHPLPLATAVTLYRFFQEALLNVVKHAEVDDAELVLEVDADEVVGTVRDAGSGFDLERVRPERGRQVGLGLLRERARLSGGALGVRSGAGAGTELTLYLPRSTPTPRGVAEAPDRAGDSGPAQRTSP